VNTATGTITWSVQLNRGNFSAIWAAPSVGHGNVYIGGSDGYCYAFSAANGSLIWKSLLVNLAPYNQPLFFPDYFTVMGAPLVAGSAVFVQTGVNIDWQGTVNGLLFALDAATGKLLWKVDPTKLALPLHIDNPTVIPNVGPWYATGNVVYTTLGILAKGAANGSSAEQASVEVLLGLDQKDGSLHSFFTAPVDGESLESGYFPSPPVPVPGGIAFMTTEPEIYVLDV
jgi:outer membrane protein assembly factor BamB